MGEGGTTVGTTDASEIVFYTGEDGRSRIQVRLDGGTVWLTQKLLADLFQVSVPTVNEHLGNIFEEAELAPEATIRKFRIVQTEGTRQVTRLIDHYNLDVILAVGYRVRSDRGTQYRRWATERLREYIVKGFVLDDERLRQGKTVGGDYFDELLERIRDIRASEKRFYGKIRDLFTTAVDYEASSQQTKDFFQVAQNKLHWAITKHTAAEIIAERADASKPNMGLTTWKGAKVRKGDVTVAKNYLNDDEVSSLNRIVTMYLDYAEEQASRRKTLTMRDWREKLDGFLQFNERDILHDAGRVSAKVAERLALDQYEAFAARRLTDEAAAPDPFEEAAKQLAPSSPGTKQGPK
jgi:hypothetical protein